MNKDWLLFIASALITLCVSLGLIRWLAPELLGLSPDLQLVQIDEKVPPYFDNVFRINDFNSREYLIKDPVTGVRAIPLFPDQYGMGPNDLLGFRNRSIPHSANIIILGDSQSYGNNAVIEQNWPGLMLSNLKSTGATAYNMSVGGWAAPQYFNMLGKSLVFKPEVIIIAIYTGNDPIESFVQVYGNPLWSDLIPDQTLSANDAPEVVFPTPKESLWPVTFKDGVTTEFTPSLRLTSNSEHPAVAAGYKIIETVVSSISESVSDINLKVIFTIIPTKELVYAKKVSAEGLRAPVDYQTLVNREKLNIEKMAAYINTFPHIDYVDVLKPLQQQAMQAIELYPENQNGHPVAAGYAVIGEEIAKAVKPYLSVADNMMPDTNRELVSIEVLPGQFKYLLIKNNSVYFFDSLEVIEKNGWPPGEVKTVTQEDIAGYSAQGTITQIDPALYGPLTPKSPTGL